MKIIAIGDIHGRKSWKNIVSKEDDADLFIFIGDYFDDYEKTHAANQIENFKDILEFKKKKPSKVVLLFGNHDFHYLKTTKENYSGFQQFFKDDIGEVLHRAINSGLMQMCYEEGKFLFSHAGVTKTWCTNYGIDTNNIERSINELFLNKPNSFGYGDQRNFRTNRDVYGNDICMSPIWVRPESLWYDAIDNCIHVVGHTQQEQLDTKGRKINQKMILIDTLPTSKQYLQIIDGEPSAKKINPF